MRFSNSDKKTIVSVTLISLAFILVFTVVTVVIAKFLSREEPVIEADDTPAVNFEHIDGVWIASVSNIDFPSCPDLTESELKAEIESIVNTVYDTGLDSIFFQVRPSSDALYRSDIFPVSKYLSSDGSLPLDALDYMIKKAGEKGIEIHAWVNPLRATAGSSLEELSEDNPARRNPEWCVEYADGKIYYDCGIPAVRELIVEGISEIVENYDVAGVVFDDYFYPYPKYETDSEGNRIAAAFADDHTFDKYGTNFDDIGDWRRQNVNELVKAAYKAVKMADPDCVFGVSPFGIWKNGYGDESGSATRGSQSYFDIYCDTLAWVEGGYVDYIAPQLYWTAENDAASYTALVDWWSAAMSDTGVPLLISHAAYRYDEWEEPQGIITSQINYARECENYRGSIFYGYEELFHNTYGITDEIKGINLVDNE